MQDCTAADKWVVAARRLIAIASEYEDAEISIPTGAGADAAVAADAEGEGTTDDDAAATPCGAAPS